MQLVCAPQGQGMQVLHITVITHLYWLQSYSKPDKKVAKGLERALASTGSLLHDKPPAFHLQEDILLSLDLGTCMLPAVPINHFCEDAAKN